MIKIFKRYSINGELGGSGRKTNQKQVHVPTNLPHTHSSRKGEGKQVFHFLLFLGNIIFFHVILN